MLELVVDGVPLVVHDQQFVALRHGYDVIDVPQHLVGMGGLVIIVILVFKVVDEQHLACHIQLIHTVLAQCLGDGVACFAQPW